MWFVLDSYSVAVEHLFWEGLAVLQTIVHHFALEVYFLLVALVHEGMRDFGLEVVDLRLAKERPNISTSCGHRLYRISKPLIGIHFLLVIKLQIQSIYLLPQLIKFPLFLLPYILPVAVHLLSLRNKYRQILLILFLT